MNRNSVLSAAWNVGFGAALSLTVLGVLARLLGTTYDDIGPLFASAACLWMLLWLWRGFRHD